MATKKLVPSPLPLQVIDTRQNNVKNLGKNIDESSTTENFQQIAIHRDLSPRSIEKQKLGIKQKKRQCDKSVHVNRVTWRNTSLIQELIWIMQLFRILDRLTLERLSKG